MTIKKNIIIASLALCTLHTHTASNNLPPSLATHQSIPAATGTIVGYIMSNPFGQNSFGATGLTETAMDKFSRARINISLSKKMSLHITDFQEYSNRNVLVTPVHQECATTQTCSDPRLSEFEILKQVLYETKGKRFQIWFESRYTQTHPTKDSAWALYWHVAEHISCVTCTDGQLHANAHIGEHAIMLTDAIWQEMLSIKSRILNNKAQSGSLQK